MHLYDFSDINELCKLLSSYVANNYSIWKVFIYLLQTIQNYDYSLEKNH